LLGNDSVKKPATNTEPTLKETQRPQYTQATIEPVFPWGFEYIHSLTTDVFSVMSSDARLYNEKPTIIDSSTRVEAGSNTSTVTLRVVRGDEKGRLKSETVKYGPEYQGIRNRERLHWQGPAAYTKDRPVLSWERAPHKNKAVSVKR
jgi:hypothetical protein